MLATSLAEGRLPWWSPLIGAGYPLIAGGEIGALYPLNLLLHALLPAEVMLTVSVLVHLLLSGLGMAWLARTIGLSRGSALLSALTFALGGFLIAHASHVSIIGVCAWMPWVLVLLHRAMAAANPRERAACAAGLAGVIALQFLVGHAQMSLLILIPSIPWATYLVLAAPARAKARRPLIPPLLAATIGTLIAAPQLLETLELTSLSQRAAGLASDFYTGYSFHPLLSATFLSPFLRGNPYPEGTIELMGYLGLAPLALSWIAIRQDRGQQKWLLLAIAVAGLLMAFGEYNPLYALVRRVPILNLFRAPARYLLWTSFGLALLAGTGLDRVVARRTTAAWPGTLLGAISLVLALASVILIRRLGDADEMVALWRWLPLVHGAALALWLLGVRLLHWRAASAIAMTLLCADLFTYGAVLRATYTPSESLQEVLREPAILPLLSATDGPYRIWTKESILPFPSVQKESLFPNIASSYGVSSANIYTPLVPQSYLSYIEALDAERLNRLNVRYYIIPQLLPVDEASELYDVLNPFSAIRYRAEQAIGLDDVVEVQVESYVSHAADREDGEIAGTVELLTESGERLEYPVRVGLETAEWAYMRSDVSRAVRHSLAPIASTFSARSGFPPEEHAGHTYLARFTLASPARIESLRIMPQFPEAYLRIEQIRFVTSDGREHLASDLLGLGEHAIVYRSEDAVVYENRSVWPRAYTVPLRHVSLGDGTASLEVNLSANALGSVDFLVYEAQRVRLECAVEQNALLVLADMAYPGWQARVDGAGAPIMTVDGLFRGLLLTPGQHIVVFEYHR